MKNKLVLLSIFFVQYLTSIGQFSVKIINENFNSNMMRWEIHQNENSGMNIQNGKYILSSLKEGTAITSTIEAPHIQESNFIITASLTKQTGIDENGFGIVWGSLDANNEFEFVISGNGEFKVIKWEKGNKSDLIPWSYSNTINKWDLSKNILSLTNSDHLFKFYINGTYVAAVKELAPMGNRVGFVLNEEMKVEADYILVENLTANEKEYTNYPHNAQITKLEYFGSSSDNELKYNETGSLIVQIKNNGNSLISNLMLKTDTDNPVKGLDFNPITMIEKINPNETINVTIKLNTTEELPNQKIVFNISLQDVNLDKIDFKELKINTIGKSNLNNNSQITENTDINEKNSNAYIPNSNESNAGNNTNQSEVKNNGCTNGCTAFGVIMLILTIVAAII